MLPYSTLSTVQIGPLALHVWGIFAALGFFLAILFTANLARKRKLDPETVYDFSSWIIIGGIIGARLVFIVENPWAVKSLIDIIALWNGGMAFHGGFLGSFIAMLLYAKIKKVNFWKYADIIAVSIPLGHAIGRIGCYLTGLHIGKPTDVPWAVYFNGAPRHPTPLYEFIALMAIFAALLFMGRRTQFFFHKFDGFLLAAYVLLYSVARFFIEFFRDDPLFMGLTIAQYITFVLFAASAVFIVYKLKFNKL